MPALSARRSSWLTAIVALALVGGVASLPAAAAPPGWTSPEQIPGTSGLSGQVSATAPDGTDAVLWIASAADDQVAIRGRVRAAGTEEWVTVQAYVTDVAQDLAVAADPDGDFWLTWVRYNPNTDVPQVLVSRLNSDTATLTPPQPPFDGQDYGHQTPRVAVADNGTVFVATVASPKVSSSPPTYRVEVGMKRPGEAWNTRFLSPADVHTGLRTLAVSPNGHAIVAFTQGYLLADMKVRAATRPKGADSTWSVATISVPGDAQNVRAGIGQGGMAAVEWNAPSTGTSIVRLAYRDILSDDAWVKTDLISDGGYNPIETPVVDPDNNVTGLWWDGRIWARQLQGGVLQAANLVSPSDLRSDVRGVLMGSDGRAAMLYQQYDTGPVNLGLRFRWVDEGVPAEEQTLTLAGDGSLNSVQLGLDAADRANVVWTSGDYPDTELQSMGNPLPSPVAVSAPHFGEAVTAASLTGRARVGRVLTCAAGYVVEANDVGWRWYRQGERISGESGRSYQVRAADEGKRIKCAMVARGIDGSTTLTSPARLVG